MISRREALQVAGTTSILAALGLPAGCASSESAAAAWRRPGQGAKDVRRWALAHAILAPNPHNKQPWLVRLTAGDVVELYVDPSRLLPKTDPFDRQITIGCGAFLELLEMAAAEAGYRVSTSPWPEGQPEPRLDHRPFARVAFRRDAAMPKDPLFAYVLRRRTNRLEYDVSRPVAAAALAHLADAERPGVRVGATAVAHDLARLRPIVRRGYLVECDAPAPYRENIDAMRIGAAEIDRHRDGISLSGTAVELGALTGVLSRKAFLQTGSTAASEFRKSCEPWVRSSMAFAWLTTQTNTRHAQIEAGRAYLRLNLLATALGLAMQPWSQCLQEYPEMRPVLGAVHHALGVAAPARIQMLVRLGYAGSVPPAPRRGLDPLILA